jgi:integrase
MLPYKLGSMLENRGEAMSEGLEKRTTVLDALRRIQTPYRKEVDEFVDYLTEHQTGLTEESIDQSLESLSNRTRRDRSGKEVSFSASWYNQRLKAVKQAVRYLLDHSPELTNGQRYTIEKYLQKQGQKKSKEGISKAERVPTQKEIETLIREADSRLSLMIEFLAQTSCRVSEMLAAETGKARKSPRITYIEIQGKGGITRDLKCSTDLYERIEKEFHGRLLFEHSGKPYSRISTTNRIKQLAERTIGKAVTAHMIRHYRGTVLSDKYGISKAASELGHQNIRNTKQYYDHSELGEEEFLESL